MPIRTTDKNLIRQFQSAKGRKPRRKKPPMIRQASYADGVLYMPIKTVSESNARDYWRTKADRAYYQRIAAKFHVMTHVRQRPLPLQITLTRIGPRHLDSDNLAAALKAVRDGVMDGLGHADDKDSDSLRWVYGQRRGLSGEYGVEVKVERI